jgi:hypothetical protein
MTGLSDDQRKTMLRVANMPEKFGGAPDVRRC